MKHTFTETEIQKREKILNAHFNNSANATSLIKLVSER